MAGWDPYYLARWLYRRLREDETREARFERAQDAAEKAKQDRAEARAELADQLANLPTAARVAAARATFDRWEAANLEAIMDLQEDLRVAEAQLETVLARAFVLPDGRSVFKTADGQRGMDERCADVTQLIAPDLIEDHRPAWETFQQHADRMDQLNDQLTERLEFQSRMDTARDRMDSGELSVDELDALEAELGGAFATLDRARQAPQITKEAEPGGPAPLPDALPQATPSPVFQPGW